MSEGPKAQDPSAAGLGSASGRWVWNMAEGRLHADAHFAMLCGLDPAALREGAPTAAFVSGVVDEDRLKVRIALAGVRHGSDSFAKEYRVRGADGAVRWVSARGRVERDGAGAPVHLAGQLVDITDQKRVQEQLRIAQTAGGVGTFEHTEGFGTAEVSEQFCRLLGLQPTDSLPVRTINGLVVEGDPPIVRLAGGEPSSHAELRIRTAGTGEERWLSRRGEYVSDASGRGQRFVGVIYDITAAKAAEAELRLLTQTLEVRVAERTRERDRVWNRARDLFLVMSRERTYLAVNPAWETVLGYRQEDLLGAANGGLAHPDDAEVRAEIFARLRRREQVDNIDVRMRAKDGAYHWINWTFIPEDELIYGMGRDITDRKQLEEQLRQSQKMEAVGQLTGGLAHDFNNMLTGIMGGLDVARRRIAQGRPEEASQYLDTATAAAERAAALTHRLLAFARRQSLDSQALDVNALVQSIEDMLRRTLGEQAALSLSLEPDLWPARADANQLESAILNLAINARDAMPGGGQIAVSTRNLSLAAPRALWDEVAPAGDYVVIAVRDTGEGMTAEVLSRVLDPFFTTKPIGQGTGLGLSMVYGFVRQSGGHIDIDSRVGKGTEVRLYLPRAGDESARLDPPPRRAEPLSGDGERVLLVEDDPQVRILVKAVLEELGYEAVEATDGRAALAELEDNREFDLMISDVGLPGMNGRQLADLARELQPGLPVLFMTGYTPNAAERNAFLAPGMTMITKPFTLDALAAALQAVLAK